MRVYLLRLIDRLMEYLGGAQRLLSEKYLFWEEAGAHFKGSWKKMLPRIFHRLRTAENFGSLSNIFPMIFLRLIFHFVFKNVKEGAISKILTFVMR